MRGLLPLLGLPWELVLLVLISTSSIETRETRHAPLKGAGLIPINKLPHPFVLGF
jgi:hypothetical protein